MVLKNGEIIFIAARRLFDKDLRRLFVGEVLESSETIARVRGYAFVFEDLNNDFVKRDEVRTRIISLTDAVNIINVLPSNAVLEDIRYQVEKGNQRIITDGITFKLNISEFSSRV